MNDLFGMLVGLLPPARLEYIIETEKLLNDMNVSMQHEPINSILASTPELSGMEIGETIEYVYYEALNSLIGNFGVRLIDDQHSLSDLLHIMRGINSISDKFNHAVVEEKLEDGTSAEEQLSSILSELETPDMFWFLGKLDYVDMDLIIRIKSELNNVEFAEELGEKQIDTVDNYRNYMTEEKKGVVYENLDSIEYLPMSFRTMVVALQDQFIQLDPVALVEQLYQLNILSDESDDNFRDNVFKVIRAIYPNDVSMETQVSKLIDDRGLM